MTHQLIDSETDVFCNLAQQNRRNVTSPMNGHCRATPVLMPELFVRPPVAYFLET